MTREEALKIVRENYPHFGTTEPWLDLEKALATLIPELSESEDERIRKELIEFIKSLLCNDAFDRYKLGSWIAYLEKQKLPTDEEMLRTLRAEYEKGVADTIAKYEQKEQKEIPLMNGDAGLYFDNWIQHNDTTKRGCFEEGIRYAQRLQKEQNLIMANSPQLKEQKPQGVYVDCTKHPEWYGMPPKEQKPADLPAGFYVTLPDGKKYYTKEMRCKGMNVKVVEPKPTEWGKEDEEIANTILNLLCSQVTYVTGQGTTSGKQFPTYPKERDWFEKRFKSLRPQPKVELSEDVKKTLDEVSNILIGLNYKQVAKDYKQAIEKLLYSRPRWKPSEHQMNILKAVKEYVGVGSGYWGEALGSLIEDLEKL